MMDYRKEVLRTLNADYSAIKARLDSPEALRLLNAVVGLSGESGEVLDLVKKWLFHGTPLDYSKLQNELGDCRFYLELALSVLNKTIEEIEMLNSAKLRKRYPNGFSEKAAAERLDVNG